MKRLNYLCLLCTLLICSIAHAATVRTVALSGKQAPGVPSGENFNSFLWPVLNDAGQTAFFASSGELHIANGFWSEGSGSLAAVARTDQQVPGLPDGVTVFIDVGDGRAVINNAGPIAFSSFIEGPGVVGLPRAILSDRSGSLGLVVRTGDHAPGTPAGVNYSSPSNPVLNNAGQIAFVGKLSGPGVSGANSFGIWSEGSGTMALVAQRQPSPWWWSF